MKIKVQELLVEAAELQLEIALREKVSLEAQGQSSSYTSCDAQLILY